MYESDSIKFMVVRNNLTPEIQNFVDSVSSPMKTFQDMSVSLSMRYGNPNQRGEAQSKICRLQQTGSVRSYYDEFAKLADDTKYDEEILEKMFVGGLKPQLRYRMDIHAVLHNCKTVLDSLILAQKLEKTIQYTITK